MLTAVIGDAELRRHGTERLNPAHDITECVLVKFVIPIDHVDSGRSTWSLALTDITAQIDQTVAVVVVHVDHFELT